MSLTTLLGISVHSDVPDRRLPTCPGCLGLCDYGSSKCRLVEGGIHWGPKGARADTPSQAVGDLAGIGGFSVVRQARKAVVMLRFPVGAIGAGDGQQLHGQSRMQYYGV